VSVRRARRRALTETVIFLFRKNEGRAGSPRITDDLRDMGWRVSKNTVAAIMAERGLRARPRRRRKGTTRADRSARKAPDLLHRHFAPPAEPDRTWVEPDLGRGMEQSHLVDALLVWLDGSFSKVRGICAFRTPQLPPRSTVDRGSVWPARIPVHRFLWPTFEILAKTFQAFAQEILGSDSARQVVD